MKNKHQVGVVVGRFQVDELHEAHRQLLLTARKKSDTLIVLLGTTVVRDSDKNPLDYATRKVMIEEFFKNDGSVIIAPLADAHSDEVWSNKLDRLIDTHIASDDSVVLFGGRDSFIPHYKGKYRTEEITIEVPHISATQIRAKIAKEPITTAEGRRGAIHKAGNQYPKVHPTVDIAIVRTDENGKDWILLGRKPDEDRFRLFGGFADPEKDKSFEDAATREGREETGGKWVEDGKGQTKLVGGAEFSTPEYIGSFLINDWRYRNEINKIITSLFLAWFTGGDLHGTDDIAQVKWVSFDSIVEGETLIVPAHKDLIHNVYVRVLQQKI